MKKNFTETEIPFGAKDSELYQFTYTIPDGYSAEIKDGKVIVKKKESEDERIRKNLIELLLDTPVQDIISHHLELSEVLDYIEKQKEQKYTNSEKPKEWSEEDEKMHQALIHDLGVICEKDYPDNVNLKKELDWFKFLSERFNLPPKQEWSEEDWKLLDEMRDYLMSMCYSRDLSPNRIYEGFIDLIDRLKSIRPQSHWKPSEEQIKAVDLAIRFVTDDFGEHPTLSETLRGLYNDIKKL